METIRTFIAIELTQEIKDTISRVIDALKREGGSIRWVEPRNLPLTLKFLGNIGSNRIDEIMECIKTSCNGIHRFYITVRDVGTFPNLKRPKVIWIGAEEDENMLKSLYERMENEFEKIGIERENRGFSPHLTVGRVRTPRGLGRVLARMDKIEFETRKMEVDRIILMKSDLRHPGPIYSPLGSVELEAQQIH